MVNPLFRQVALDQVSSPDQLDQLLHITRPRAWLALLGLGAIVVGVLFWSFGGSVPIQAQGSGILAHGSGGLYGVEAPNLGTIASVPVHLGDQISAGQQFATLTSADGTTTPITSPRPGTVISVSVEMGSVVTPGQSIGVVDPSDAPLQAYVWVPAAQAAKIEPGMQVRLQPATARADVYGDLLGTVAAISRFPARPQRIAFLVQNDTLVNSLTAGGPVVEVDVNLTPDPSSPNGYLWSSSSRPGRNLMLTGGTPCSASIVIAQQAPRSLAFPQSNH